MLGSGQDVYVIPERMRGLSNLYWRLRYCRDYDSAARRKWYRRIRVERDRLVSGGEDGEYVRLMCRWLADPREGPALARVMAYEQSALICRRFARSVATNPGESLSCAPMIVFPAIA